MRFAMYRTRMVSEGSAQRAATRNDARERAITIAARTLLASLGKLGENKPAVGSAGCDGVVGLLLLLLLLLDFFLCTRWSLAPLDFKGDDEPAALAGLMGAIDAGGVDKTRLPALPGVGTGLLGIMDLRLCAGIVRLGGVPGGPSDDAAGEAADADGTPRLDAELALAGIDGLLLDMATLLAAAPAPSSSCEVESVGGLGDEAAVVPTSSESARLCCAVA